VLDPDRLEAEHVWLWLTCAIASEVTATLSLRMSQGFTRIGPSAVVVLFYGLSFYCLSQTLTRGMAVGVAYAVWSAIGVTLIAAIGALFLGERLTWVQVLGIALVVVGVLALRLGGSAAA
jgi:small multidrug resistance pump